MEITHLKEFTEANRRAWNEVMPYHQRAAKDRLDQAFAQTGHVHLAGYEVDNLLEFGIQGKDIAHLCCNNGTELMSLKNLGAGRCAGFDISDEAIREASQRAAQNGIGCEFIRSNVYEIDDSFSGQFDMVYISAGCLGWMPDLALFFAQAARLLKPGGRIFIHEIHPFAEMIPMDGEHSGDALRIVGEYFKKEPYVDYEGLDYVGGASYAVQHPQYWFVHTLAEILTGLIASRFVLQQFKEFEKDISAGHLQAEPAHVPLSYILTAVLPA